MLNSGFLRHKAIIACSVAGEDGKIVYGGHSKRGKLLEPDPTIPIPCHLYDTAMLFVPRDAFTKVALPSDIFTQSFFDYGCFFGRGAEGPGPWNPGNDYRCQADPCDA